MAGYMPGAVLDKILEAVRSSAPLRQRQNEAELITRKFLVDLANAPKAIDRVHEKQWLIDRLRTGVMRHSQEEGAAVCQTALKILNDTP